MSSASLFFLKTLLLLWIFSAVVCGHHKRDVHHRIIIQERIPSNQKKGHHSHHHGRGHSQPGISHGHGRKNKGSKKHRGGGKEGDSFEDAGGGLSRENSFEDLLYKSHNSHHQKKAVHVRPSSTTEYLPNKQEPYRDNLNLNYQDGWIPMSSEQLQQFSQETYGESNKKRKNSKNKNKYIDVLKPPPVEITTSYPFQFDASSMYPQLSSYSATALSNYNINKKFIGSNHSPLIDVIEQSKTEFAALKDTSDKLKNHRTSYEAAELAPAASDNINTFVSIPYDSEQVMSDEGTELKERLTGEARSAQESTKNRGRLTYRGNKKI